MDPRGKECLHADWFFFQLVSTIKKNQRVGLIQNRYHYHVIKQELTV